MLNYYEALQRSLRASPKLWVITGVAGFIGSNILQVLLGLNQRVIGLDNFSTGSQNNLDEVEGKVSEIQWKNFHFVYGDIRNLEDCKLALSRKPVELAKSGSLPSSRVDYVLHQAALGSVPRSLEDPITTNANNIDGFLNMLVAGHSAKVTRLVFAASSSTYGDHQSLPKIEDRIGKPLSPYAVTKLVNELYAQVFSRCYGFDTIGLRYFNVFGPRQDSKGSYAAVIPRWATALLNNQEVVINGDGETSRDFCFIDNAVAANLLAATASPDAGNNVYNIAAGDRTTLNELYSYMFNLLKTKNFISDSKLIYKEFRSGDVRHSLADISKAEKMLKYRPLIKVEDGIRIAMDWYIHENKSKGTPSD